MLKRNWLQEVLNLMLCTLMYKDLWRSQSLDCCIVICLWQARLKQVLTRFLSAVSVTQAVVRLRFDQFIWSEKLRNFWFSFLRTNIVIFAYDSFFYVYWLRYLSLMIGFDLLCSWPWFYDYGFNLALPFSSFSTGYRQNESWTICWALWISCMLLFSPFENLPVFI